MYLNHLLIKVLVYLLLSFRSSLCIWDNSTLSDGSFCNIFSKSVACLFIPFILPVTEQKFLILMSSHFSVTSFMGHV